MHARDFDEGMTKKLRLKEITKLGKYTIEFLEDKAKLMNTTTRFVFAKFSVCDFDFTSHCTDHIPRTIAKFLLSHPEVIKNLEKNHILLKNEDIEKVNFEIIFARTFDDVLAAELSFGFYGNYKKGAFHAKEVGRGLCKEQFQERYGDLCITRTNLHDWLNIFLIIDKKEKTLSILAFEGSD